MAMRMPVPNTHHHVYVRHDDHGWIPVRMRSMDAEKHQAIVSVDRYETEQEMIRCLNDDDSDAIEFPVDLRDYQEGVLPLQNTDESGKLIDYQDMVDMPYLHEVSTCTKEVGR